MLHPIREPIDFPCVLNLFLNRSKLDVYCTSVLVCLIALSVKQRILVETDHSRKSVTARMDDSDASPISESEVLEGSVASAVVSGSAAPEFIRLPECERRARWILAEARKMLCKKENQTVLYDRNDHMEEKHYHR